MKFPPEDFLRALLHDETATAAATIDTETTRGETGSGTGSVNANAIVNASVVVVVVVVELVVKGKFTHEDVEGLTGAFARFGRVLSVLLDDERFSDAAVVCLEASVDNIVTAIQTLNHTKIGKSLLFHPLTVYSNIAPSDHT